MKIEAVIGANYGDEGKGLITDYLCRRSTSQRVCVVRFNGGAQAGHTVVTPNSETHVFHHFGAGTLAGADTFLSSHFIVNPLVFRGELATLAANGITPQVLVSGNARVTTPLDMLINQALERKRGRNALVEAGSERHGSCGLGIFETVLRSKDQRYLLTVGDLFRRDQLLKKLKRINGEYARARLGALGLELADLPIDPMDTINSYLSDTEDFLRSLVGVGENDAEILEWLSDDTHLVFEGAQGLLLSETNVAMMPHLTPSNTGVFNVGDILSSNPKTSSLPVHAYYVTRTYLTRHGAGPFNADQQFAADHRLSDLTNVANPWQGAFKYAPLDDEAVDQLFDRIDADAAGSTLGDRLTFSVAATCADQVPPTMFKNTGHPQPELISYGPSSIDVRELDTTRFITSAA